MLSGVTLSSGHGKDKEQLSLQRNSHHSFKEAGMSMNMIILLGIAIMIALIGVMLLIIHNFLHGHDS
ncbi:hypothetical protein DOE63_14350 [Salmonella enterica subsp. diarizonae serovar 59:z10:-]|nr:hypothetical protein DOE63_14350 [Salmonella enterica subsp. diarizonae serovar 59:z10:-]